LLGFDYNTDFAIFVSTISQICQFLFFSTITRTLPFSIICRIGFSSICLSPIFFIHFSSQISSFQIQTKYLIDLKLSFSPISSFTLFLSLFPTLFLFFNFSPSHSVSFPPFSFSLALSLPTLFFLSLSLFFFCYLSKFHSHYCCKRSCHQRVQSFSPLLFFNIICEKYYQSKT